jgi:hypothetical protein
MSKKLSRRGFLKLAGVSATTAWVAASCRSLPPATPVTEIPNTSTASPTLTPAPSATSAPTITPTLTEACPSAALEALSGEFVVKGERYTHSVPDTFDLQARAELALSAMTSCTDPQDNNAPYDSFALWRNPPVMFSKTLFNGKYFEAAALLRYMTGSGLNRHVDQTWRKLFLETIIYGEYPWWGVDGGRLLAWLGNNYRIEKNPCWLELGDRAVERLAQKMAYKDNYCYFPDEQGAMPTGWEATWGGWVIQGLANLYLANQSPKTLDLASKLARYLKDHAQIFDAKAHFLARHPSDNGPALHFHHNGNALEGLSAYAAAAGDSEFASFARSGYEWLRSIGSPLVGFFPEYINDWPDDRPYVDCETCCTADMIQMGMTLSESGQGDYWDDVDRYLRNQFAEMQLLDTGWIDQMVAELPVTTPGPDEDSERVSERIVGSFASWATANDWYIDGQPGTTFCCIGNGARALYYVWEKMIGFKNGTLSLHLLLNRASAWADVDSYIPYEGRVDVALKTPCNLKIRIPEWVKPDDVTGVVNGTQRQLTFQGRYALVGYVEPGSLATLTFPIAERVVDTPIGNVPYALTIKGNDVVSIDPPGKWYPFYQRSQYRENQTLWVERERFVPAV